MPNDASLNLLRSAKDDVNRNLRNPALQEGAPAGVQQERPAPPPSKRPEYSILDWAFEEKARNDAEQSRLFAEESRRQREEDAERYTLGRFVKETAGLTIGGALETAKRGIRGGDKDIATDDWLDQSIQRQVEKTKEYIGFWVNSPTAAEHPFIRPIASAAQNFGYSAVSLVAALAGTFTGGIIGAPGGPVGIAAGAGIGAVAGAFTTYPLMYRAMRDMKLNEFSDTANSISMNVNGRELTHPEWERIKNANDYENLATQHANYETIPEIASAALSAYLFTGPGLGYKLIKGTKFVPKIARGIINWATALSGEQVQELYSNYYQQKVDYDAGIVEEMPTVDGILREQFMPVAITTTLFGGLGSGMKMAQGYILPSGKDGAGTAGPTAEEIEGAKLAYKVIGDPEVWLDKLKTGRADVSQVKELLVYAENANIPDDVEKWEGVINDFAEYNAVDYKDVETVADAGIDDGSQTTIPHGTVPPTMVDPMSIEMDEDSYQFRTDAQPLAGDYNAEEAKTILIHERVDGTKYVVDGHQRLALAKQSGVPLVNAQIVYEKEGDGSGAYGWTVEDAAKMGAIANIKDGKGSIYDRAKFIRQDQNYEEKDYPDAGIANTIGRNASDNTFDQFVSEQITPSEAAEIADAAPGDDAAQNLGLSFLRSNKEAGAETVAPGETADHMTDVDNVSRTEYIQILIKQGQSPKQIKELVEALDRDESFNYTDNIRNMRAEDSARAEFIAIKKAQGTHRIDIYEQLQKWDTTPTASYVDLVARLHQAELDTAEKPVGPSGDAVADETTVPEEVLADGEMSEDELLSLLEERGAIADDITGEDV